MAPRITLGDGLDSLRQIDFQIQGKLPSGTAEGKIIKYNRCLDTPEKLIRLAENLGISNVDTRKITEGSIANMTIFEDEDSRLTLSYHQGAWYYELIKDQPVTSHDSEQVQDYESIAVQWLAQRELLPQGPFTITEKNADPGGMELVLEPPQRPDGMPLIGVTPHISLTVNAGGEVIRANGLWYTEKEVLAAPLIDFNAALKALQRGEGVFTGSQTKYPVPGKAVVEQVKMAYQLSYGLDYTPYLIPVAVFTGSFTPQGEKEEGFTAYVSLLQYNEQKNVGNFKLQTKLPVASDNVSSLNEKTVDETASELPAVARFLGMVDRPGPDGDYNGPEGRLFLTSYDSGWLYRSSKIGQSKQELNFTDEKIVQIANKLAEGIPLPGKLGQPFLIGENSDGFRWVIYPLLYNGNPVIGNEDSGYVSRLGVQVGADGKVWSVNCAHPMQSSGKELRLLSPEQAWKELLANQAEIHVEGFFGRLAGNRFNADESIVTEVKLVYVPEHPELPRNQNYEVKYSFKGTARVGGREIKFNAFVDAVK